LVGKKTNSIIFNNASLNEKIPKIFDKICAIENDNSTIERELAVFEPLVNNIAHYLRAFEDLKKVSFNKNSNDDKLFNNHALRTFIKENNNIELELLGYKNNKTFAYTYTLEFLENKKATFNSLVDVFLKQ